MWYKNVTTRIGVLQMDTGGVLQLLNFRRNIFVWNYAFRVERGMGRGIPSLADLGLAERRELPRRGPGRSPGRKRIFGIFEVHRTLLVERTVSLYRMMCKAQKATCSYERVRFCRDILRKFLTDA